jgi:hypothetical protein
MGTKCTEAHRRWTESHRDRQREYDRAYKKRNREKIREYRLTHPEEHRRHVKKYKEKNPEKVLAHELVRFRIPINGPCEVCGGVSTERHHPDYSKPLEVMIVCRKCHREFHRRYP